MSFQEIFQKTDVSGCLQPGMRALGEYSRLIECETPGHLEGSMAIDDCLKKKHSQENRWDYALGFENRIYYVEVHHLSDSEVSVVIAKYR